LKKAYRELEAQASLERNPRAKAHYQKAKEEAKNVDPQIKLAVRRVKRTTKPKMPGWMQRRPLTRQSAE
jgi:hypothetical protein